MRVRIKYSKQGLLKFIGHLDMMRAFQKLLRRADIDVTFSEGYSPHMIMSYAFPLGVGMTSDSEYVDVDLNQAYGSLALVERLNEAAPEGVHILDAREVPTGKANKGMTLVARADYTLAFRPGHEWPAGWDTSFGEWIRKPEILAVKKGKKTEKEINLAPLIYEAQISPKMRQVLGIADIPEAEETGGRQKKEACGRRGDLSLALAAGSSSNIRPDLVVDTFARACGYEIDPFRFQINRDEVYADREEGTQVGKGTHHSFVPLIELGKTMPEASLAAGRVAL